MLDHPSTIGLGGKVGKQTETFYITPTFVRPYSGRDCITLSLYHLYHFITPITSITYITFHLHFPPPEPSPLPRVQGQNQRPMAHASPLTIKHIALRPSKASTQDQVAVLTAQVRELQKALSSARQEIEFLTAERDELVTAIKEWSTDDWNDQLA